MFDSQVLITAGFMLIGATMFRKATKEKLRARIAIDGPAGAGKTYSALRFAFALAGPSGRVVVIDTEHRSASKYTGENPDEIPFEFDVCELEHYAPSTYVNVINAAGEAGYDVLVIDSLSHAWEGVGGALDIVDRKASSGKGGSFAAWRDVTPMHRALVEAILSSPCHVIATMRSKMAYEVEQYEEGGKTKTRVNKLGTKPVQREGVEYEFDIVCDMDIDHVMTVSKTRCPALDGQKVIKPSGRFLLPLIKWLSSGTNPKPATSTESTGVVLGGTGDNEAYSAGEHDPCGPEIAKEIKQLAKAVNMPANVLKQVLSRNGVAKLDQLPYAKAMELAEKLRIKAGDSESPF